MYTVSDIIMDVNRHCMVNNMVEDKFSYRIVCFINAEDRSEKHYIDARYKDLRSALENVIRRNLTTTNAVVIASITVKKNREIVSLLSKAYAFSLEEYFCQIYGKGRKRNITHGRYALNAT